MKQPPCAVRHALFVLTRRPRAPAAVAKGVYDYATTRNIALSYTLLTRASPARRHKMLLYNFPTSVDRHLSVRTWCFVSEVFDMHISLSLGPAPAIFSVAAVPRTLEAC